MQAIVLMTIWLYRKTRILRTPACRFYPSCSQYMATSIRQFGLMRGIWMGASRLSRCHPYHPGGVDEVPARRQI